MKLENQVVSLELAKKLKSLNVKQESLFKWHSKIDIKGNSVHTELVYFPVEQMKQDISAFTVAELGEMLPKKVDQIRGNGASKTAFWLSISFDETSNKWRYSYANHRNNECIEMLFADNEADARAEMLVYLLENKLLTL